MGPLAGCELLRLSASFHGHACCCFRQDHLHPGSAGSIIVFIVRYLRMQMEKSLRLQQVTIKQQQAEAAERQQAELDLQRLDTMPPRH
ncbi:MAG: hypothetical protein IPO22_22300 [Anaerolineales bacterium]|nr:hypothetical protein [Anaerolineales bacterium]